MVVIFFNHGQQLLGLHYVKNLGSNKVLWKKWSLGWLEVPFDPAEYLLSEGMSLGTREAQVGMSCSPGFANEIHDLRQEHTEHAWSHAVFGPGRMGVCGLLSAGTVLQENTQNVLPSRVIKRGKLGKSTSFMGVP